MENLTIVIRKDLGMRKGKMAAQSCHAAMKLLLETMIDDDNNLKVDSQNFNNLKKVQDPNSINFVLVNSEQELDEILAKESFKTFVIDHGRTEFNGVKTKTCGAFGLFSNNEKVDDFLIKTEHERPDIFAKQIIIFSNEVKPNIEVACKLAVIGCLKIMASKIENSKNGLSINLNEKSEFADWLNGAFAKISLLTKKDEDLYSVMKELDEAGISFSYNEIGHNKCIVVEPKHNDNINPITSKLSLI